MIKSVIIKESLPDDLLVKVGTAFIALVKPASIQTGQHTSFYVNKACTLTSVRGIVKFSSDNSTWNNSLTVNNSGTKVYIKTSGEDGIVFGNGSFFANNTSEIKDTLILVDLFNLANSNIPNDILLGANQIFECFKGDISVFKGKQLFKSKGIQMDLSSFGENSFIFGDITGVMNSQNYCGLYSTYIFGDITEMLAFHEYDAPDNKQVILKGNDTTTYDKFTCKPFDRGKAFTPNDRVVIEQQMRAESIINILMSLSDFPNANRVVTLNGEENANVDAAISAFITAGGGTLTYNGTVRS